MVVLVGLVVEAVDTGLCSVTSLAMLILSVMIFITGLLHPMVSLLFYCKNINIFFCKKKTTQIKLVYQVEYPSKQCLICDKRKKPLLFRFFLNSEILISFDEIFSMQ